MTTSQHDLPLALPPLEMWGGLECTVNRVADCYFNQIERSGHAGRADDLARFAALGIRALRYPVLWERHAPVGGAPLDWRWCDERLHALRRHGVKPIAGLVHHGSGPPDTNLLAADFAPRLADYAAAVARRYPWLGDYTPVNEPLTTARFSGLYGLWYPHRRDDRSFVRAVVNQCKAVALSMRAIRGVNPQARLVQTDDLGKTFGTAPMAPTCAFYNERRWLCWDLLCGKVERHHPLWDYLVRHGAAPAELLWFGDQPCRPDVIGVNYYVTSERWLDHRTALYPGRCGDGAAGFADVEAVRVAAAPAPDLGALLREAWQRYRLPLAVTEAHLDGHREDQLRWLLEIWDAARQARRGGVDVRAVTAWALLGSYDWNCLLTACHGYYESGAFDLRSATPRATAVATLTRELAQGRPPAHPVLPGQGWWRRPERLLWLADGEGEGNDWNDARRGDRAPSAAAPVSARLGGTATAPILISGASGTLGRAFARICTQRNLAFHLLGRQQMDIADPVAVQAALRHYRPWALVNTSGYVKVDQAETDIARCFRENTAGAAVLAAECQRRQVHFLTFSSDLVFDGSKQAPYVEADPVAPLNIYGKSKAEAEQRVLGAAPAALVVRSSAFFGPWDDFNFLAQALAALERGQPFAAAADLTVSPTYVPDLVHACLDLLIDKESGIWHLTHGAAVTWADLALQAALTAGVDSATLAPCSGRGEPQAAPRPEYSALSTDRGNPLPTLDDALARFILARQRRAQAGPAA